MILLTLASKQIWPQVLAVAHLKESHQLEGVILLHSDDLAESKGPAQRLQSIFEEGGLVPKDTSLLESIPHDDFTAIEKRFDEVIAQHKLSLGQCIVNFTGGNKLMAAAVFHWMARRGVRGVYLERDRQITWFDPCDGDLRTHTERLCLGLTNDLDAASLLTCQFGHDVVPFPGERLTLNPKGIRAEATDLSAKLSGETRLDRGAFDFTKWLQIENPSRRTPAAGDNLEYGTACALLKAGIPSVRRGVELAANPKSQNREAELDLVFNWNGRLWVVDCKDRIAGAEKVQALRTAILGFTSIDRNTELLLSSISDDLKDRDIKILREDILQIAEVGGLLGCALAVRSTKPPVQAVEFAASRHPRVEILLKADLVKRLPAILEGRRAP